MYKISLLYESAFYVEKVFHVLIMYRSDWLLQST